MHITTLLPAARAVSPLAAKRLKAIEEYSHLGAGFRIALRDLEIRGAGNILGPEQSGHIQVVGYQMYCELLADAVRRLNNEPAEPIPVCVVDLGFTAYIPKNYIPAVEKGVKEAMARGVVAGYPMTNVSVDLTFGSYHDVDSSELAFKLSGSMAFKEAAARAGAVLLEPIMAVEVVVPEEFMGDITGSLSGKRGQIDQMEDRPGGLKVIKANVPLSEMFGYMTELRSQTQGRGSFSMEPHEYAIVPKNVADEIIAKRQ